jgi:gluconolactonase
VFGRIALPLALLVLAGCAKDPPPAAPDAAPVDPLKDLAPVTKVASGFQFTEGPLWMQPGYLLFSDVLGNQIERLDPPSAISVFRKPSNLSNGLAVDPQGLLIACEGGAHRVTRTLADGTIDPIATTYGGKSLNSPNDVICASTGTIYFTDPDLGATNPNDKQPFSGVFRILPDKSLALVSNDMQAPNGIALSVDEKTLYVGDSAKNFLRTYVVHPDGSADTPALFANTATQPDGFTIDDNGNLYVATQAGVQVYAANGTLRGTIVVPEQPTNCAFAGADRRTLYITAQTSLYQVHANIPGRP